MQTFLALAIINSLSFCFARCVSYLTGGFGAILRVLRPAQRGKQMYYLVPGFLNQGETAFEFLLDELSGGITLVNYRPTWGCSMRKITKQVARHADTHDYRPFIVGISIGDYVARGVTVVGSEVQSVPIDPEPHSSLLVPRVRIALRLGAIVTYVLTVILGWLSLIPWYSRYRNRFSLAFIADQLFATGFTPGATNDLWRKHGVLGIIVSQKPTDSPENSDTVIDSSRLTRYFLRQKLVKVTARYAKTVEYGDKYLAAWRQIMAEASQTKP